MRITSMLLAEGIAQDAEGAFSAIRIGRNFVPTTALPVTTKRAAFVAAVEEGNELVLGSTIRVTLSVTSPTGVLVAQAQTEIPVGPKQFPDHPGEVGVPAEFILELSEYGEYLVVGLIEVTDLPPIQAQQSLFVVPPVQV